MDYDNLISAGISSSILTLAFGVYQVMKCVIGHRLISDCCGRRYQVGIDVRTMGTTPQETYAKIAYAEVQDDVFYPLAEETV